MEQEKNRHAENQLMPHMESKLIKYGFVVLNYNNFQDTAACVESILKIERNDYRIIVVDNCSQNESVHKLRELFEACDRVELVQAPKNLGYSGGNNIGIRLLVGQAIRRVIIATNDTEVLSVDILDRLDALNLDNVGIVGPKVIVPDGSLQNPQVVTPGLLYLVNLYCYKPYRFFRSLIYRLFPLIEQSRREQVEGGKRTISKAEMAEEDCPVCVYMLHGCFFYLTEHFIDRITFLDDNVFMYYEEDLLAWRCELAGLDRLYAPGISILHKDRKSTETTHSQGKSAFIETQSYLARCYLVKTIGFFSHLACILRFRARLARHKSC